MRPVGFRNTGAIREQGERTAALAAGAAQVGEPTSFKAGAGAPEPIAVMRGTATTFSPGRLPGHQFAEPEMATPLQAQQAWNRGMRGETVAAGDKRGFTTPEATLDTQYGGFREPGQTGKEIAAKAHVEGSAAAAKNPYYEAMAGKVGAETEGLQAGVAKVDRAKVTAGFDDLMHESPYSTFDTKSGKTAFKAQNESQYRDYLASKNIALAQGDPAAGPAAGRKHFEERQQIRQYLQTQPLAPNTNIDAMLDAAASNPEHWQGLVTDAQKVMKTSQPAPRRSSFFGPTQLQGEAGAPPPAVPAAPAVRPTQPPAGFRGLVESME
jgi:hypothetical protein